MFRRAISAFSNRWKIQAGKFPILGKHGLPSARGLFRRPFRFTVRQVLQMKETPL
jgi:hypothetical protein